MNISMAVFYGSSTGNTEAAAFKIKDQMGDFVAHTADVAKSEPQDLLGYDLLFLGVSTWNIGDMQDDWADFIPKLKGLDFSKTKVALFAMGDAQGYPYNFLDAMGELWGVFKELGAELIGVWPTEGYTYNESRAQHDETHFVGLGLDEDNEPDLTDDRIHAWLLQVMQEIGLLEANA